MTVGHRTHISTQPPLLHLSLLASNCLVSTRLACIAFHPRSRQGRLTANGRNSVRCMGPPRSGPVVWPLPTPLGLPSSITHRPPPYCFDSTRTMLGRALLDRASDHPVALPSAGSHLLARSFAYPSRPLARRFNRLPECLRPPSPRLAAQRARSRPQNPSIHPSVRRPRTGPSPSSSSSFPSPFPTSP
ncbi:hypothetical protein IWX92DRAFT_183223 [Phyllosticta citricarpa]